MLKIVIFDVLNSKIDYFCHLEKFNVVNNYIWWVTQVKIIIDVLWYQTCLFLRKKKEYLSFAELNVWKLISWTYNYLSRWDDQELLFLTVFSTKGLKWLSLTLYNVIYSYLCRSLILWNLEKSTKFNDCLTMKFYRNNSSLYDQSSFRVFLVL